MINCDFSTQHEDKGYKIKNIFSHIRVSQLTIFLQLQFYICRALLMSTWCVSPCSSSPPSSMQMASPAPAPAPASSARASSSMTMTLLSPASASAGPSVMSSARSVHRLRLSHGSPFSLGWKTWKLQMAKRSTPMRGNGVDQVSLNLQLFNSMSTTPHRL